MIERLAIFGATGDLTARYLLPGLAALQAAGQLSDRFQLTGVGREEWDTGDFRHWAAAQLDRHGGRFPAAARQAVVSASSYHQADVADIPSVAEFIAGDGPVAAYLALPPAVFPVAVSTLHDAGLPPGSRLVLEKPFGEDLDSAVELNRLLAELVPEPAVFRVDHFLAMTTVQNILGTRLANRMLEPIWNSTHIAEVDIVWDESLALEGRAGYYDGVGALKDMLQNHLLQLLCLVAMEPPISLGERDLRDRKLDVLRSVRPLTDSDVVRRTRRARYLAGQIGDQQVPAYVDEEGVSPRRSTETFAEMELELDNWRWPGTVFRLRTGKALGRDRKEVAVHFRSRTAPAVRPRRGSTAQRAEVRARPGKPHPGPDRHRGPRAHSRPAGADRPDRSARAACLRSAPAGRAERQCRLVDPRRRSRTGLAGRRSGAVSLVEGSRPDAGVPGRLPGPGCRGRITTMTPDAPCRERNSFGSPPREPILEKGL